MVALKFDNLVTPADEGATFRPSSAGTAVLRRRTAPLTLMSRRRSAHRRDPAPGCRSQSLHGTNDRRAFGRAPQTDSAKIGGRRRCRLAHSELLGVDEQERQLTAVLASPSGSSAGARRRCAVEATKRSTFSSRLNRPAIAGHISPQENVMRPSGELRRVDPGCRRANVTSVELSIGLCSP